MRYFFIPHHNRVIVSVLVNIPRQYVFMTTAANIIKQNGDEIMSMLDLFEKKLNLALAILTEREDEDDEDEDEKEEDEGLEEVDPEEFKRELTKSERDIAKETETKPAEPKSEPGKVDDEEPKTKYKDYDIKFGRAPANPNYPRCETCLLSHKPEVPECPKCGKHHYPDEKLKYDEACGQCHTDIPSNRDIGVLRKIVFPLKHGWTENEVVEGMMPYVNSVANKYQTERFPFEDAVQEGLLGVLDALRTDKGAAPFAGHAYPPIKNRIMRASARSGIIKRGIRAGSYHDTGMVSLDMPSRETGVTLAQTVASKDPGIASIFGGPTSEEKNKILRTLMRAANLTPQQERVMILIWGLDGKGNRTGPQAGLELAPYTPSKTKMSRERVNQHLHKALRKVNDTVARMKEEGRLEEFMEMLGMERPPSEGEEGGEFEESAVIRIDAILEYIYKMTRNMIVEMVKRDEVNILLS